MFSKLITHLPKEMEVECADIAFVFLFRPGEASFEITCEVIVRINSIPSSSKFVINGWHCRQCGQGILNRSGHAIVDNEFLFVEDGSIRLWEHRIRASHLLIHMISDSWTTQKENVQKFIWNIFIIPMYGLVHFHQNTRAIFCRIPCNQRYKNPQITSMILFGVHLSHQWWCQC